MTVWPSTADAATAPATATAAAVDVARLELLYRELLHALGEDPDRDGLRDTPRRAAAAWAEFLHEDHAQRDTTFPLDSAGDGYVLARGISLWSICEHHLLPFHLTLSVAYLPSTTVLGLSKLVRIAQHHARRLQLQERICDGIAAEVAEVAGTSDVGVWAVGEHLCMRMRGVRTEGCTTVTERLRGRLTTDSALATRLSLATGLGAGMVAMTR